MATITRDGVYRAAPESAYVDESADGWLTFAGLMLGLAGTLNLIDGIVALARSKFFVADAVYVFSDLRTWGWIMLVLGSLELTAAGFVMTRSQVARWFGIFAAALNAIGQLLVIQAYPFWALSLFAVDIAIIYGLSMYGSRRGTES